jgi:hypothetical protein
MVIFKLIPLTQMSHCSTKLSIAVQKQQLLGCNGSIINEGMIELKNKQML